MINTGHQKCRVFFSSSILLVLLLGFVSFVYASQEELDAINGAIKGKRAHWAAGETSVSKLSPQERKARLPSHTLVSTIEEPPSTLMEDLSGVTALSSLDWRNYNSFNYVTPVRNQGNCGSCWAFATTAALESAVLITQNTPGINLDLSEQTLVSCSLNAGSCSGGYIDRASDYIRDFGQPIETCFPYVATDSSCLNACLTYQSDTDRISGWHWVATASPTVDAIKNALSTYGPLVTTMHVYSDFYYYITGTYSHVSGTYQGGHAILIVGYDDAQQYFIVKNSWGTGWGEAGYFKIAYSELTSVVQFGFYTIAYEQNQPSPPLPPPTCTYALSPSAKTFKSSGGTGSVSVSTQSGCSWTAMSNSNWITIQGSGNGTGNGVVNYSVSENPTDSKRTGTMTIAGQAFNVIQSRFSARGKN